MSIRNSVLGLCLLLPAAPAQPETSLLVRLAAPTSQLLDRLAQAGLELLPPDPGAPGEARLILAPGEQPLLASLAPAYEVLDRGRPLRELLGRIDAPPDARYYTHQEVIDALRALETAHPTLARVYDLTAYTGMPPTHEGRRLYALKISDTVGADEDEPNIAILGGHHAREVNTQVMAIEAARRLLDDYAGAGALKHLVDSCEIWVVPVVNPDGLEHVWNVDNYWRKNRRPNAGGSFGVDLNRNYPFRWKQCGYSTNPASDTYCGPSAASEPCVRTVIEFAEKRHFERVLDFHSYGREVVFPYSPCTTSIPIPVRGAMDAAVAAMKAAGGYGSRLPSASGEEPEHQWAARGTFAFLVEVMRAFQPAYPEALTEEQTMVWPIAKTWMELPVPATGHVRDLAGRPLAAEIAVIGVDFAYGERLRSGGPHGRWFLWLAPGLYDATFSCSGYKSARVPLDIQPSATRLKEIVLEPEDALLTREGGGKIGATTAFPLSAAHDPGRPYFIGAALGTEPGQAIAGRRFPLNGDALFQASLELPQLFAGNLGRLDAQGKGRMDFHVPPWPALAGLKFWFAGFTVDFGYPFGVKSISNPIPLTLAL